MWNSYRFYIVPNDQSFKCISLSIWYYQLKQKLLQINKNRWKCEKREKIFANKNLNDMIIQWTLVYASLIYDRQRSLK